jgi:ABC-2 type transport system ATP-binding protein
LQQALANAGFSGTTEPDGALRVRTDQIAQVGHLAFAHGVELHELRLEEFDLERLFFSLTEGEHQAVDLGPPGHLPPGPLPTGSLPPGAPGSRQGGAR